MRTPQKSHVDCSIALPRKLVESTAYQELISAHVISGTSTQEIAIVPRVLVFAPISRTTSAHCHAKHSSATVATVRPTSTLDHTESTRTIRCTSARGSTDRKPHTSTYTAASTSCLRRP